MASIVNMVLLYINYYILIFIILDAICLICILFLFLYIILNTNQTDVIEYYTSDYSSTSEV